MQFGPSALFVFGCILVLSGAYSATAQPVPNVTLTIYFDDVCNSTNHVRILRGDGTCNFMNLDGYNLTILSPTTYLIGLACNDSTCGNCSDITQGTFNVCLNTTGGGFVSSIRVVLDPVPSPSPTPLPTPTPSPAACTPLAPPAGPGLVFPGGYQIDNTRNASCACYSNPTSCAVSGGPTPTAPVGTPCSVANQAQAIQCLTNVGFLLTATDACWDHSLGCSASSTLTLPNAFCAQLNASCVQGFSGIACPLTFAGVLASTGNIICGNVPSAGYTNGFKLSGNGAYQFCVSQGYSAYVDCNILLNPTPTPTTTTGTTATSTIRTPTGGATPTVGSPTPQVSTPTLRFSTDAKRTVFSAVALLFTALAL